MLYVKSISIEKNPFCCKIYSKIHKWRHSPKRFSFIFILIISVLFYSCDFFSDGDLIAVNQKEDNISSLKVSCISNNIKVGEMAYANITYYPSTASIKPVIDYNSDILTISSITSSGFVITGKSQGQTAITVTAGGKSSTIIINVQGYSDNYVSDVEPYIYSNTSILQLSPGSSQRIYVSLYNGTISDNLNYNWTIENPGIAEISSNGQYCQVKGISEGYSRIKITNSAAAYPYYIGVYVLTDYTNTTYITSPQNIATVYVDGNSPTITADLVNPISDIYKQKFNWQLIDGDTDCISIAANNNECKLTGLKAGQCTLRVTNTEVSTNIPFDILVRSIEIVDSAYIEPGTPLVKLSDSVTEFTLTASIAGLKEEKDYSNSDFLWEIEDDSIVSYWSFGNQLYLTGVHNGSTSILISHPKVQKKRQVLLICENQIADAVDSSCYITTSQNFIKTKCGASDTLLTVSLKGGVPGDEKQFNWEIKQIPGDKSNTNVISVTPTNSNTFNYVRAAIQSIVDGKLYIKPENPGTAVITVSHPKSYYTTEILVKVLPEGALLEDPLYFTGPGIVKFLNKDTYDYSVNLYGNNKAIGDDELISWNALTDDLIINAQGTSAVLSSTASGQNIHKMKISHPKADFPKEVLVLTADTEEELNSIKAFYSDKNYYSVNVNKTVTINVEAVGFIDESGNPIDFSTEKLVSWESTDPAICTVEKDTNYPLTGIVKGKKAGSCSVKIKYGDVEGSFNVTVYPENVDLVTVESSCYLTTGQNVVIIDNVNKDVKVSISAIGLKPSEYQNIEWTCENEAIAKIIGNGDKATVTSLEEGETVITVQHPLCENKLKIYIRVGSEYVTATSPTKYISCNTDVIAIVKDDPVFTLKAYLVNGSEEENRSGFKFMVEDESVAKFVSSYASGDAYVKAITAGQTEITIQHPDSEIVKKILVIVANTAEELAEFKYLTTRQNVITLVEGSRETINVDLVNVKDVVIDGFQFISEKPNIASVVSFTGNTAVINANSPGTTKITATHNQCKYPLDIIIQVIDASLAAKCPHIESPSPVLELTVSTSWTTVTAELIGGNDTDKIDFQWISDDNSVIEAYGQNGVGKVRAVGAGISYLRVSHPKAPYDQLILCICNEQSTSDCSISISTGNIMSLLPTDGDKTITASLVNGTTNDRYNFTWSLDVYDVIDLTYNANTAIVTPLREGVVQLTIHHPKAAYDQTVVIKVQQFSKFGFGQTNKTLAAGTTTYVSMEVPATNVDCSIIYEADDPKICNVVGTNAVCAITGLSEGTTMISAKLMAGTTVYATTQTKLLVNVTPADKSSKFINGSQTIYTMDKGKSRTFTAQIFGTENPATDIYNLVWTTGNPSVLKIAGMTENADGKYSVTGNSCYGTAVSSGETTLTISHPDVPTDLVYHIIVAAESNKEITLNKSYISLEKGLKTEIKSTISGASTSDYKNITWNVDKPNGVEVVRILGEGQTVSLYAINPGTTYLYAKTGEGSIAKCQIVVEEPKTLKFISSTLVVAPNQTKEIDFTMIPSDASLTWTIMNNTGEDNFTIAGPLVKDSAKGICSLTLTGLKETKANTAIYLVNSYGSTAQLNVRVSWDYAFNMDKTSITATPDELRTINVTSLNPPDATLIFDDCSFATFDFENKGNGKGVITIIPTGESPTAGEYVNVYAKNPATEEVFAQKQLKLKYEYPSIHIKPKIYRADGNYSYYDEDSGIIHLGDGESPQFMVDVLEKGDFNVKEARLTTESGFTAKSKTIATSIFKIENSMEDIKGEAYQITSYKKPRFIVHGRSGTYEYKEGENWNSFNHSDKDERIYRVWYWGLNEYEEDEWTYYDSFSKMSKSEFCSLYELNISDVEEVGYRYDIQDAVYEPTFDTFHWYGYNNDDDDHFGLVCDAVSSKYKYSAAPDDRSENLIDWDNWLSAIGYSGSYNPLGLPQAWKNAANSTGWKFEYSDEIVGNIYTEQEYKSNPYFYCPGTISGSGLVEVKYPAPDAGAYFGRGGHKVKCTAGDTGYVTYKIVDSIDTTLLKTEKMGDLTLIIEHPNQKVESIIIPVYLDTRICNKNYK